MERSEDPRSPVLINVVQSVGGGLVAAGSGSGSRGLCSRLSGGGWAGPGLGVSGRVRFNLSFLSLMTSQREGGT